MSVQKFHYGDRVRHVKRPEWGIGAVMKAEDVADDGQPCQRLSIRFPNAGVKTLSTLQAELEPAPENGEVGGDEPSVAEWGEIDKSEWLGPLAQRKIEEAMIRLPKEARDPFVSLVERLRFAVNLYRFDRSGRGLMDWAVAQSGLDDPLSKFTRHELEHLFDRWASEREAHLGRLLGEARDEPHVIDEIVAAAPSDAADVVRRLSARR